MRRPAQRIWATGARGYLIGSATLVAVGLAAGLALAATQTSFSQSFRAGARAVVKPNRSTGFVFDFSADDPDNSTGNRQPSRLVRITDTLASGTALNQDAAARCGASDADFASHGAGACPKKTKIGVGTATLRRPIPGSADEPANVTPFNGQGRALILYVQPSVDSPRFVLRAKVTGTPGKVQTLVIEFPVICKQGLFSGGQPVCGFGGEERRISGFDLRIDPRVAGKGNKKRVLVRTPPTCPKPKPARKWTFRSRFEYADGTSATIPSASSCTP